MSEPLSDYEDCGCGKCCLPTIVAERDDAIAEVRRLREENAVLARKLEATAVSVGGPHVEYAWTTGGSEVDRLHTIIRDLDRKHTGALKERNAARADLARAIELLRCITETPTPIPGVTLGDYHEHVATFLAEMEKR